MTAFNINDRKTPVVPKWTFVLSSMKKTLVVGTPMRERPRHGHQGPSRSPRPTKPANPHISATRPSFSSKIHALSDEIRRTLLRFEIGPDEDLGKKAHERTQHADQYKHRSQKPGEASGSWTRLAHTFKYTM